ncbi:MAG: hypothetical protein ABSD67_18510 [Terracidiphilus sp.]
MVLIHEMYELGIDPMDWGTFSQGSNRAVTELHQLMVDRRQSLATAWTEAPLGVLL